MGRTDQFLSPTSSWSVVLPLLIFLTQPLSLVSGLFALWAVVLAGVGLTRPSCPFDERGQRGVMAISAVLALVAMAMAIGTSR